MGFASILRNRYSYPEGSPAVLNTRSQCPKVPSHLIRRIILVRNWPLSREDVVSGRLLNIFARLTRKLETSRGGTACTGAVPANAYSILID